MITSHRNPLVKRIRKLRQKKYRQREGAFFIEGIRVVLTALEQGAPMDTIVYAPDLLTSNVALEAVEAQRAAGQAVVAVSADVFGSLSERENPVGLGAVVNVELHRLERLPVVPESIYVAAEALSDPGNLGTILRTMDGMGAAGLILVGETTDPFHPTAVKASMGALFSIPVAETDSFERLWAWAAAHGVQTVATSAHARQRYWDAGYRFPVLLLLGSEGEGLSPALLQRADLAVSIPMHGTGSSLNVAVAAGLLLYELRRQASSATS
jgi:TrmH family RNA methyltransferase